MPCNTLHLLVDNIRRHIHIPFLSLIDITVKEIKEKNISQIALLATGPTMDKGLYSNPLEKSGIKVLKPNRRQQENLNEIVIRLINGHQSYKDQEVVTAILESMKDQGAKSILLACTDLHMLSFEEAGLEVIDTMKILAKATAKEMLGDD